MTSTGRTFITKFPPKFIIQTLTLSILRIHFQRCTQPILYIDAETNHLHNWSLVAPVLPADEAGNEIVNLQIIQRTQYAELFFPM